MAINRLSPVAQAWVKVAIGICSSRPVGVPLSLRCTTSLAVSTDSDPLHGAIVPRTDMALDTGAWIVCEACRSPKLSVAAFSATAPCGVRCWDRVAKR